MNRDHSTVEVGLRTLFQMEDSMKKFITLIVIVCVGTNMGFATHTLKLLGEPEDARLLIIHADDVGMSHNVNVASLDAMKRGVVTTGSIMMPCPWVSELVKKVEKDPVYDLGLHLTLNCEWGGFRWPSVAPTNLVKGLIDPHGYMHPDVRTTVGTASPDEVKMEIRAQVRKALDMGLQPTHMDSHMGTVYYHPGFFQAAVEVAEEVDIPFMLMDYNERIEKRWGRIEHMNPSAVATWKAKGYPLIDDLLSIEGVGPDESRAFYERTIKELQPGVSLLIIHCGKASEELSSITSAHRQREMDHQIFTDPAMRELIESEGIKLIGWNELKAVWDKRQR